MGLTSPRTLGGLQDEGVLSASRVPTTVPQLPGPQHPHFCKDPRPFHAQWGHVRFRGTEAGPHGWESDSLVWVGPGHVAFNHLPR